MPIEITWDNPEKTILYTRVTGKWTWDEMHAISQESIQMRESVMHPVGSIVDFRAARGLPDDAFVHVKRLILKHEVYGGTTVFIHPDFAAVSLWHVLMSVYKSFIKRQNFRFASSPDEARMILYDSMRQQASLSTHSLTLSAPATE